MKITVYKTDKVTSKSHDLFDLLDASLPQVHDGEVVAIAAKIVSLCEGRVVSLDEADKDELVRKESQYYLPTTESKYGVSFAITRNMLIPSAGIDESNANGTRILWPVDIQASANAIRDHLVARHQVSKLGVIITDSTTRPLQWGTAGIAIAASGFKHLKDYVGQPDVFGRELQFQKASIANGLAAAAVTLMGEGNEQTPLAVIQDVPFVEFQLRNPSPAEIAALQIEPHDDLYWPLLQNVPWLPGERQN